VAPHPHYQRQGNDLIVRVPITLSEAILGAKVDVPTPKGTISLTIPAGTSGGKRLRVKGHGVPQQGAAGDLYAEIQLQLPETIDDQLAGWAHNSGQEPSRNPRAQLVW
jgi:curved DNA-binding protein